MDAPEARRILTDLINGDYDHRDAKLEEALTMGVQALREKEEREKGD